MNRFEKISHRVAADMPWSTPAGEDVVEYKSLNDAVEVTGDRGYAHGGTGIWYMKDDFFRDGIGGVDWLTKKGLMPTGDNISMTHRFLGAISEHNMSNVFRMMQGEEWSPRGEARNLIRKMGLGHTSMSVGDVIRIGTKFVMVNSSGFVPLA